MRWPGVLPAGSDPAAAERVYIANLRYAADRLAARRHHRHHRADQQPRHPGLFPQHDHPGDVGHRAGRASQPETPARPLSCADHGGRSRAPIRALAGHYPHVQIAGNPGRNEPDIGEINYPFLFDLFDELGYSGWIGCEYRPKGETEAGLGWAKRYDIHGVRIRRGERRKSRCAIVITGGCGFLGRRVALAARARRCRRAGAVRQCRLQPCPCRRTKRLRARHRRYRRPRDRARG